MGRGYTDYPVRKTMKVEIINGKWCRFMKDVRKTKYKNIKKIKGVNYMNYTGKGNEKQVSKANEILNTAEVKKVVKIINNLTIEQTKCSEKMFNRDYPTLKNMVSWLFKKDALWIIENKNNLGDVNMLEEHKELFMNETGVEKFSYKIFDSVKELYWNPEFTSFFVSKEKVKKRK